jgi:ribose/xylose/arabinose/galactoside ABC-type transport system permease subunit
MMVVAGVMLVLELEQSVENRGLGEEIMVVAAVVLVLELEQSVENCGLGEEIMVVAAVVLVLVLDLEQGGVENRGLGVDDLGGSGSRFGQNA